MRKKIDRIAVICLVAALLAPAGARAWFQNLDLALQAASAEDRLIVVDLFADWCAWCKRLDEEVFTSPEFETFARDRVLLRLDTEDEGDGAAVVDRYGVTTLPTTLILDAEGVLVGAVHGFLPAAPYVAALEEEIERFADLGDRFAGLLASDDRSEVERLADDLRRRRDGRRAARLYERLLEIDSGDTAEVRYRLADALRLAAAYDRAAGILEELRRLTPTAAGPRIAEIDLLAARISRDRGDCGAARDALQTFLEVHSASDLSGSARNDLEHLRCT